METLEQRQLLSVNPQLIRDINLGNGSDTFAELNGQVYFANQDGTQGRELWRSDGTAGGTSLFADLYAGTADSNPEQLVATSNKLFFVAETSGTTGDPRQLWTSDGTVGGTYNLTNISGDFILKADPRNLTVVGDQVFFTAYSETNGRELWVSDGTSLGTSMVVDLSPGDRYTFSLDDPPVFLGPRSTTFDHFVDFNDTLFFSTRDRLWKSDGTEAGTELVFASATADSAVPKELTVVGDTLFFTASDGTSGRELWKTDGTAAGTVLVKDIVPGADSSVVGVLAAVGDTLYFQADDGVNGAELWKSDGTAAGTVLVADIMPGSANSNPHDLTDVGGTLYFAASDGVGGAELWTSDGTAAGTFQVSDILSGSAGSNPSQLTDVGGTLFFAANDGSHGEELWTSDGTSSGTQLVSDLVLGGEGTSPRALTAFGNQVLFIGVNALGFRDLNVSDGTVAGTSSLTSLPTDDPPSSRPRSFVDAGGVVFFAATDEDRGWELWRTDGTEKGTALVKDIRPGPDSATPSEMTAMGGKLFFAADDGSTGRELWVTDGTESGTIRLTDINPGAGTSNPSHLVVYKGEVFFKSTLGQVYRTDGTVAGTSQFNVPGGISRLAVNDDLLFLYQSGGTLLASDGTLAGTVALTDVNGVQAYNAQISGILPTNSQGEVFFQAYSDDHGRELWKTDGTIAGTGMVKDIYPGTYPSGGGNDPYNASPTELVMMNDILYFRARDGVTGEELWRSDGTEAGTYLVKDVSSLQGSSQYQAIREFTVVGDQLFFTAKTGTYTSRDLWVSDGTTAGTHLVKDLSADDTHVVDNLVTVSGKVYFQAETDAEGRELWESDGTAAGTVLLADINSGPDNSEGGSFFTRQLTAIKNTLFFAATNGQTGGEPWLINLSSNTAPLADAGSQYNVLSGGSITLDASASNDPDGDDQLSYFWDLDGDGIYSDVAGQFAELDWTALSTLGISEATPLQVSVRVSDGIGGADEAVSTVMIVMPATANIGGPYTGDEGSSIPLSASASTGATLYEWDLDNDGQYDDAVGENVNFSSADNGVFTIGLRINGSGGPTDSTTVTVNNVAPTAAISGTTAIYRGEEVTFTLTAADASSVDQAGLFTFEIDWDGNGTVDETLASVPSGTAVQHTFASVTSNNIQVRAADKDGSTGAFSQMPITVTPHVLRDDGFGNTDLIWGGTSGLDAVFVLGQAPALSVFVQIEGTVPVSRLDHFGSAVTGKVIIHGYGFSDVLIAELAGGNVVEIHGGDGDDVLVGGSLGDFLYGDGGNDTLIGGTRVTDGDDLLFGGEGRDTLFGHFGADTLDGGGGEDLLISDRFSFSNVPAAVQQIANEWKSARPYSERVSNILGTTSTGVNGGWILDPASTIVDDGAEDILLGGLGESDWFFYDFDQDLLGDTIEIGEEETDSDP